MLEETQTAAQAEDFTDAYYRLKPKYKKLVDALCAGKSKTQAARIAGIGKKRPDVAVHHVLHRNPIVRAAYEQRRAELAEEAGVDSIQILHETARIAFNKKKVDSVRLRALELLGKYKKLWTEKHEHTGAGGTSLAPPIIAITFPDGGPGGPDGARAAKDS